MMGYTVNDYRIYTGRDRVTGEYVAVVREFPGLSWVSDISRDFAASGLRDLLVDVLEDIREDGEDAPVPARRETVDAAEEIRDLQLA